MACVSFTGGISNDCSNNIGGITKLYITDLANVISLTSSSGTVSSITMATGSVFYSFAFNRNSATYTEDLVKSVEAGSALWEQTVTVKIPRRDVTKRNTLALLTNRDVAVIIKDSNGLYWMPGEVEGMYLSEQKSTSGTAKADGSSYDLTLKGFEVNQASGLTSAIVTGVI